MSGAGAGKMPCARRSRGCRARTVSGRRRLEPLAPGCHGSWRALPRGRARPEYMIFDEHSAGSELPPPRSHGGVRATPPWADLPETRRSATGLARAAAGSAGVCSRRVQRGAPNSRLWRWSRRRRRPAPASRRRIRRTRPGSPGEVVRRRSRTRLQRAVLVGSRSATDSARTPGFRIEEASCSLERLQSEGGIAIHVNRYSQFRSPWGVSGSDVVSAATVAPSACR